MTARFDQSLAVRLNASARAALFQHSWSSTRFPGKPLILLLEASSPRMYGTAADAQKT